MELKIGTALSLEPTTVNRDEKFHCKVIEVKDNIIYIDYPKNVETKKTVFLVSGSQFRVSFTTDGKESYEFNTEVLGRKPGNIPTILLACPPKEEFIKIQRRQFVRIETPADVAIEYNGECYQFITEDISAGGLAIQLKKEVPFEDGEILNLTIVLPFNNGEIHYVQTTAKLIRKFNKGEIRIASLQLTDTDDIDKQYIVRYCFERQLMLRKTKEFFTFNNKR